MAQNRILKLILYIIYAPRRSLIKFFPLLADYELTNTDKGKNVETEPLTFHVIQFAAAAPVSFFKENRLKTKLELQSLPQQKDIKFIFILFF